MKITPTTNRMARTPKSNIPKRGLTNKTMKKGSINKTDGMQSPIPIHNDVQDLFLINSASSEKNPVTALSIAFVIHSPSERPI